MTELPIWEINWNVNLAVTDASVSLLIWISYSSVHMNQTEQIPNLLYIRKDNPKIQRKFSGYILYQKNFKKMFLMEAIVQQRASNFGGITTILISVILVLAIIFGLAYIIARKKGYFPPYLSPSISGRPHKFAPKIYHYFFRRGDPAWSPEKLSGKLCVFLHLTLSTHLKELTDFHRLAPFISIISFLFFSHYF